jgi:hypothetical protein
MNGLGTVLTYEDKGCGAVGGQQVGADGSGWFSVLFNGEPNKAHQAAVDYIRGLEKARRRIKNVCIVVNEDGYYGPNVRAVVVEDCLEK